MSTTQLPKHKQTDTPTIVMLREMLDEIKRSKGIRSDPMKLVRTLTAIRQKHIEWANKKDWRTATEAASVIQAIILCCGPEKAEQLLELVLSAPREGREVVEIRMRGVRAGARIRGDYVELFIEAL